MFSTMIREKDMSDDTRPFPIQAESGHRDPKGSMVYPKPSSIPWWLAEEAWKYYTKCFGTSYSLEHMVERGGFGRAELLMLLRREIL